MALSPTKHSTRHFDAARKLAEEIAKQRKRKVLEAAKVYVENKEMFTDEFVDTKKSINIIKQFAFQSCDTL